MRHFVLCLLYYFLSFNSLCNNDISFSCALIWFKINSCSHLDTRMLSLLSSEIKRSLEPYFKFTVNGD